MASKPVTQVPYLQAFNFMTGTPAEWDTFQSAFETFMGANGYALDANHEKREPWFLFLTKLADINSATSAKDLIEHGHMSLDESKKPATFLAKVKERLVMKPMGKYYFRSVFRLLRQEPDEKIETFAARINKVAPDCAYPDAVLEHEKFEILVLGTHNENIKSKANAGDLTSWNQVIEQGRNDERDKRYKESLVDMKSGGAVIHADYMKVSKPNNQSKGKKGGNAKKRPCDKCGRSHPPRECPAYGKECHQCKKTGHFAKFCRSQKDSGAQQHQSRSRHDSRGKGGGDQRDQYRGRSRERSHRSDSRDSRYRSSRYSRSRSATRSRSRGRNDKYSSKRNDYKSGSRSQHSAHSTTIQDTCNFLNTLSSGMANREDNTIDTIFGKTLSIDAVQIQTPAAHTEKFQRPEKVIEADYVATGTAPPEGSLLTDKAPDGYDTYSKDVRMRLDGTKYKQKSKRVSVKIDSGATACMMPLSKFKKYFPETLDSNGNLKSSALSPTECTWAGHDSTAKRFLGVAMIKVQSARRDEYLDTRFYIFEDRNNQTIWCIYCNTDVHVFLQNDAFAVF